jgi:hypothetical protein
MPYLCVAFHSLVCKGYVWRKGIIVNADEQAWSVEDKPSHKTVRSTA